MSPTPTEMHGTWSALPVALQQHPEAGPEHISVYLAVAYDAGRNGWVAEVRMRRIQERSKLRSYAPTRRAIDQLEEWGFWTVERRPGWPLRFRLLPTRPDEAAAATEAEEDAAARPDVAGRAGGHLGGRPRTKPPTRESAGGDMETPLAPDAGDPRARRGGPSRQTRHSIDGDVDSSSSEIPIADLRRDHPDLWAEAGRQVEAKRATVRNPGGLRVTIARDLYAEQLAEAEHAQRRADTAKRAQEEAARAEGCRRCEGTGWFPLRDGNDFGHPGNDRCDHEPGWLRDPKQDAYYRPGDPNDPERDDDPDAAAREPPLRVAAG